MSWFVYILECSDKSLYTGVTTALERRVEEHNEAKAGAKYTRARRPVRLVYYEPCDDRADACRREFEIKQLSKRQKLALLAHAKVDLNVEQNCS